MSVMADGAESGEDAATPADRRASRRTSHRTSRGGHRASIFNGMKKRGSMLLKGSMGHRRRTVLMPVVTESTAQN